MKSAFKSLAVAGTLACAAHAGAQVTFFQNDDFTGRSFTTDRAVGNFDRHGFNDRASSVIVQGGWWEACSDRRFDGQCVVLRPGRYPSLRAVGLNDRISSVRPTEAVGDGAQVTFFQNEDFRGRSFTTDRAVNNFNRFGFNDRASSVIVRGGWWEACSDRRYDGQCVVLRPGSYPSLRAMGLNDRISSVRPTDAGRYGGRGFYSSSGYDYRRRHDERLYEAPVTAVHAVVGPPEQRCWVERQAVSTPDYNVPGAIAGAVIGGILGHQIGGGRGQDVATGVGAVGGAALGANVGRNGSGIATQDVQRCETVARNTRPDYWDVTYNFRGEEHRVQLTSPPGPTILVNSQGEPRV